MNSTLPLELYTGQQVKHGEQQAAKLAGVELYTLMLRAGLATYQLMRDKFPHAKRIVIMAGTGNNGGDGFVVAKLAKSDGLDVSLYLFGDETKISGDAAKAKQEWMECGGDIQSFDSLDWSKSGADVLIDGLLGTGLTGEVRQPLQDLIAKVNDSQVPVIAVDTPSGLCTDSGQILGNAIIAKHTVTFIGVKQGLTTGQARAYTGQLHYAGLGVENEFRQCVEASSRFIDADQFRLAMPPRIATAHKGHNGRLLCLGGNQGYAGAIRLCATAGALSGAGLIRTLCHPSSALPLQVACPEVMTSGWGGEADALKGGLDFADVIAVGPGLGTDNWAQDMFLAASRVEKPKVIDADGLNLLARQPNVDSLRIITPHPGEAARLLGCSVTDIEQDRFQAVRNLHKKYGGIIILKGAGTLIFDGDEIAICQAGNAGMATGGMGDVLTGLIAALVAQGMSLSNAAKFGVLLHSVAADQIAIRNGQIGLLASDVIDEARTVLNHSLA
ncbi:NAD(P)H-hydrate dehydratase [Vibrio europaeus]|uniref:NAD(P)H-hydrate dehydratase n=1 Tax=Vibrio europaeus TaxID=300876 RepID=UPI00233E8F40|nr:NAD(P)H-hydrate dehydratase [Vibrio europaeus]MDC5820546.1 NAD(P)H-hydrate dehydratase [Vibrio europaeus]MDC5842025.1 NAD(P)H-hydrate dehydratase [Vibrio europaeus]MDC5870678.1 NAD(P)H-hydrate dehydratase [Vibrio europaeus]